jgi:hypothetical protein
MMPKSDEPEHRGRFQAQSDYLEESEGWAQKDPLMASDGHRLLTVLENRLEGEERRIREDCFKKAHRFIDNAGPGGVGPTTKGFPVRGRRDGSRVDIEVKKGLAFVVRG